MKRFLFIAAMLISVASFTQTTSLSLPITITNGTVSTGIHSYSSDAINTMSYSTTLAYTSDQTITVQQGSYKTGTITPSDGDGVITIVSILGSYQASLVSVGPDPSDTSNHLKYRITGVAAGNATVVITWKNSQNQQFTYTTTVTVVPPPPTTAIVVTYN